MKQGICLVGLVVAPFLLGGCGDGLLDPNQDPSLARSLATYNVASGASGLQFQPAIVGVPVLVSDASAIVDARIRWVGRGMTASSGDDTIVINSTEHVGTMLGFQNVGGDVPWAFFYELDATGLVVPGSNLFFISGLDFGPGSRADGVAALVIYEDAAAPWTAVHLVEPAEFVESGAGDVWSFPIGFSPDSRGGRLLVFAGDATLAGTDNVWWEAGPGAPASSLVGSGNLLSNRFTAALGSRMDVLSQNVTIPAGSDHLAYQLESPADGSGDSLLHFLGVLCTDGTAVACTGTVSGRIWHDADRDGVDEPGENGLLAVDVTLWNTATAEAVASAATTSDGHFQFNDLCTGTYELRIDGASLPDGYEPTTCGGGDCLTLAATLDTDDDFAVLASGWAELEPAPENICMIGFGRWKIEFDIAVGRRSGDGRMDAVQLQGYLADIAAASSHSFTASAPMSLDEASEILNRKGRMSYCERTEIRYLVMMLNYALNGSHPNLLVDTDGDGEVDTPWGDVIEECDGIFGDTDKSDAGCRHAKQVINSVNDMPSEECSF